jgi:hexulose-6-phosphate isomerase
MKTGINQWAFPCGVTTEQALDLAKKAGFETFEACVDEEGPLRLDATEADATAIRRRADKLNIEITSVGSGMGWKYPLSSPDPAVRELGKEAVATSLRIARWLGADTVLVVPGLVTPDVPYDLALENALTSIEALAPAAEQLQVSIGLENVWNKFLLSPIEMRGFIDQCESAYVGAYFDIGNILPYGYPEQWIRILGKRIRKVHAKDFRASTGNLDGFVMLLEGDVNWPEVMAALREIGYNGALTAEFSPYKHAPEVLLRHAHASLAAIIKATQRPSPGIDIVHNVHSVHSVL